MSKTIIVTGAGGQLGPVVIKKLLEENHKVIAVVRNRDKSEIKFNNLGVELHAVNLSGEAETEAFAKKAIETYGKIDGALLLAGGFAMGDISTTDSAALHAMLSLNFETAYYLARPLFQHMMENGYGRLVFMGARAALEPKDGKIKMAYGLSKSLLFQLADMLNAAAKGKNVVTSVVVPSTIDTPPNRAAMPDANFDNWVKPDQIAELLAFICSDKALAIREPVFKLYNNA